jgi:hypothetical protein
MAQLPVLFRPKYILRRKALRSGLFGPSRIWRLVAFVIIFENGLKKFFGRQPDRLGARRIGAGHVLTVAAYAPLTRRQAKRAGVSKSSLAADAHAELEAAQSAS